MENKKKWLIKVKTWAKDEIDFLLIIAMLAVVVIITFSCFLAVKISQGAKKAKAKEIWKEEEIANTVRLEEEERKKKLPVLSEEAKVRLENIYVPQGEEKQAYLTFDDGPSGNITPQILDILNREGIKATFFVLGSRVELYPEILKREYEEGHYIANHGYSHVYTNIYSSQNAVLDEYNRAEARIKSVIRRRIFKPLI